MLNIILWICQVLLAIVFAYSGLMKATHSEKELIAMGQTGVENLPISLIRFIGISEILGVIGILLPWMLDIYPILTPIAAVLLGVIMIPAAVIHWRRNEKTTVLLNLFLLILCAFVAWGRLVSLC